MPKKLVGLEEGCLIALLPHAPLYGPTLLEPELGPRAMRAMQSASLIDFNRLIADRDRCSFPKKKEEEETGYRNLGTWWTCLGWLMG